MSPPPAKPKRLDGTAGPVVLQLLGKADAAQSAFVLDDSKKLRLAVYNFGDTPRSGKLSMEGAAADTADVTVAPGAREERTLKVIGVGTVTARLELGRNDRPLVSARVTQTPAAKPGK
jgi:hypothetical protein